jgi:hypothetical protein
MILRHASSWSIQPLDVSGLRSSCGFNRFHCIAVQCRIADARA